MGVLCRVKEYEQSFNEFLLSVDELYKAILKVADKEDREMLLVEYGKLDKCREDLCDSKENLIEALDDCIRI